MNPNWFSLFKNNNNIEEGISEELTQIFKKCKNPHIICIYGDARTGKSTKMNQIINGTVSENYFDLKEPFKTRIEMYTTMTKGCNLYGPIKVSEIANKNSSTWRTNSPWHGPTSVVSHHKSVPSSV